MEHIDMQIKGIRLTQRDVARFERFVASSDGCWGWKGHLDKHGYGTKKIQDVTFLAHRVAWAIAYGDPGDAQVLHRCDNRACVRPDHLFKGDHVANMKDMRVKGRAAKGERQHKTTLTADEVRRLREQRKTGKTFSELAAMFNVCPATASNIVNRVFWRHV